MITRNSTYDSQHGSSKSLRLEMEEDMTCSLSTFNIRLQDMLGNEQVKFSMEGNQLQYQVYDSVAQAFLPAQILTQPKGNSILQINTSTLPVSGTIITGFSQVFTQGTNITFSVANQQLTLQPGNYLLKGTSQCTFFASNGLLLWYPHSYVESASTRLGSPNEMYQFLKIAPTSTSQLQESQPEILISVVSSPLILDVICDTATSLSSIQYLQLTVSQL